jgi:hypothetical protein
MCIGGSSETELFQCTYERSNRAQSGMDDEEDEKGDMKDEQDQTWKQLEQIYLFLTIIINLPEFDIKLAQSNGAFDQAFATKLVAR